MANPPVPPIKWVGRDAVGNLVDVTAETSGMSSPLSIASGEQTIRLLGPFRVEHDTSGITSSNPPVSLVSVDPGSVVLGVWADMVETWDVNADDATLLVGLGDTSDPANWLELATYKVGDNAAYGIWGEAGYSVGLRSEHIIGVGRSIAGADLVAYATNTGGATTGAVDVYALIAEAA